MCTMEFVHPLLFNFEGFLQALQGLLLSDLFLASWELRWFNFIRFGKFSIELLKHKLAVIRSVDVGIWLDAPVGENYTILLQGTGLPLCLWASERAAGMDSSGAYFTDKYI